MSQVSRTSGMSVAAFRRRKDGQPLVCLTAYTTPMARLLDPACDLLLVGDSLGMVVHGLPSTVPVTLDLMVAHGAAVVRGAAQALVAVDLPFGSYQESPAQAFQNAARVIKETQCGGIKLEGGRRMGETIRFLTEPTSRTYAITYSAGRELCEAYVAGEPDRFRRLLTEQVRVRDLLEAARSGATPGG